MVRSHIKELASETVEEEEWNRGFTVQRAGLYFRTISIFHVKQKDFLNFIVRICGN